MTRWTHRTYEMPPVPAGVRPTRSDNFVVERAVYLDGVMVGGVHLLKDGRWQWVCSAFDRHGDDYAESMESALSGLRECYYAFEEDERVSPYPRPKW